MNDLIKMNDDWVLGACGCWSVVSWGEKMVMTLALRLFPHTTLELVLHCNRKFEFSVAHYYLSKSTAW